MLPSHSFSEKRFAVKSFNPGFWLGKNCVCFSLLEQKPKHESVWYEDVWRRQVSCHIMKSYMSKLKLQGSSEHITSHHHFWTINKAVSGNLLQVYLRFSWGFPCCRSMPHGSRVVVLSDDPSLAISWGLQFRTCVTPASFGICWMAIAHCDTLTHWYRWISVCPMQDLIQKETCVRCSHHDLQIHCRYGRIVQWRNRVPETSVWLWYVVVSAYHANKFMNAVHR